jgi:hypothetical protein
MHQILPTHAMRSKVCLGCAPSLSAALPARQLCRRCYRRHGNQTIKMPCAPPSAGIELPCRHAAMLPTYNTVAPHCGAANAAPHRHFATPVRLARPHRRNPWIKSEIWHRSSGSRGHRRSEEIEHLQRLGSGSGKLQQQRGIVVAPAAKLSRIPRSPCTRPELPAAWRGSRQPAAATSPRCRPPAPAASSETCPHLGPACHISHRRCPCTGWPTCETNSRHLSAPAVQVLITALKIQCPSF